MNVKNETKAAILKTIEIMLFLFILFLLNEEQYDNRLNSTLTKSTIAIFTELIIICYDFIDRIRSSKAGADKKQNSLFIKESSVIKNMSSFKFSNFVKGLPASASVNLNQVCQFSPSRTAERKAENAVLDRYLKDRGLENAITVRDALIEVPSEEDNSNVVYSMFIKQGKIKEFVDVRLAVPSANEYEELCKRICATLFYHDLRLSCVNYVLLIDAKAVKDEDRAINELKSCFRLFKPAMDSQISVVVI